MNMSPVHQVWPKHLAGHSDRGEKTRKTNGGGKLLQGMDRPEVRHFQEGSGEQKKKMWETSCEVIYIGQTTPAVDEEVNVNQSIREHERKTY